MIFLFFSSSLACLEPELELFEVWEINVRQIIIIANGINSQTPKLQTALARVLDKLERNQKKENHLHTISKMMGTFLRVSAIYSVVLNPSLMIFFERLKPNVLRVAIQKKVEAGKAVDLVELFMS